jgi:hypothetical protein
MPVKTVEEFEKEHGGLLKGKQTTTLGEFDGCAKTFIEGDKGGVATKSAATTAPTTTATAGPGAQSGVKSMVDGVADGRTTRSKATGAGAGLDASSTDYKIANQAAVSLKNNFALLT